jgi:hypothetical protein
MAETPYATMASGEFERRVQQVLESPHKASVQEVMDLLREALAISSEIYSGRRWQSIETAPRDGEMILAATADGRMMIWKASLLQVAMEPTLSRHLQFPATHWMPLPEPPEVIHE